MIVRVRYGDGRLETFDTASFTAVAPFQATNMLTDFCLRLDDMEGGLWLEAHCYDISSAYSGEAQQGQGAPAAPVARRKMGWRFLLAEAGELAGVQSVAVDGTALAGHDVVAFEELARDGVRVAAHADIDDEAQTVALVSPALPWALAQTGEGMLPAVTGALIALAACAAALGVCAAGRARRGADAGGDEDGSAQE